MLTMQLSAQVGPHHHCMQVYMKQPLAVARALLKASQQRQQLFHKLVHLLSFQAVKVLTVFSQRKKVKYLK